MRVEYQYDPTHVVNYRKAALREIHGDSMNHSVDNTCTKSVNLSKN